MTRSYPPWFSIVRALPVKEVGLLGGFLFWVAVASAVGQSVSLAVAPQTTGTVGSLFSLTATVENAASAPIAAGEVSFYDGSNLFASAEIDSATGTATFATRSLRIGNHSITAVFNGTDLNPAGTSNPVTVSVTGKYTTTTALSGYESQGAYSFIGEIDAFGLGNPSGSVTFTDISTNPASVLGTVPLTQGADYFTYLPSTVTTASPTDAVITGDFDGDGRQDLAVSGSNLISIFLGNGGRDLQAAEDGFSGGGFYGRGRLQRGWQT